MRFVLGELSRLHSEVLEDPVGRRVMEGKKLFKIDEVEEVIRGRRFAAELEVREVVAPMLERQPRRMAAIRERYKLIEEGLPRLRDDWEAFLRCNYVSAES